MLPTVVQCPGPPVPAALGELYHIYPAIQAKLSLLLSYASSRGEDKASFSGGRMESVCVPGKSLEACGCFCMLQGPAPQNI